MTPNQTQLWQLLALPAWHCAHPERLPFAPSPAMTAAEVLIILGQGKILSATFIADIRLALSLTEPQLQVMDEASWLAAKQPSAPILLGLNLTSASNHFHWHDSLPMSDTGKPVIDLSAQQKQALWSCLCRLYFAH